MLNALFFHRVSIEKIFLHQLESLRDKFESTNTVNQNGFTSKRPKAYNKTYGQEDFIIHDLVRKQDGGKNVSCEAFVRAGPRSTTHFDPTAVRAAIVTCGGLCPGLNNVVREITRALIHMYNVPFVMGIR